MAVTSTTYKVQHTGNGIATSFAFGYLFLENSHLRVTLTVSGVDTVQTITTHYTVSGARNPAGGTVTFVTAPASGAIVTIERIPPVTQETDYQDNDPFPASSHEDALDKLTMLVQRIDGDISRSVRFPSTEPTASSALLPAKASRLGKVLRFNETTGNPEAVDILDSTTAIPSQAGKAGQPLVTDGADFDWAQLTASGIADGAVTTGKVADGNVTNAKMSDMAAYTIKGNDTASPAAPQDLTVAEAQTLLGIGEASRNVIINGSMQVWQRGTSFSNLSGSAAKAWAADRWLISQNNTASNSITQQSQSDGPTVYCMRIQRPNGSTSTDEIRVVQGIETFNCLPLVGEQVTLSFYARRGADFSGASNRIQVRLAHDTTTDENPNTITSGSWTGDIVATTNVDLTTSWQRFTYTGTVPAGTLSIGVQFGFTPVGTAGAADYWELKGVQLEAGANASNFLQPDFTDDMLKCLRYWRSSFRYGTKPVQNSGSTRDTTVFNAGGGIPTIHVPFDVAIRTTSATVTTYSHAAATANFAFSNGSSDTVSDIQLNARSLSVFGTNPVGSVIGYLGWEVNAEL